MTHSFPTRRSSELRCATRTAISPAATRSGARRPRRESRGRENLVWPAARADDPVPDPDVGAVLLLRDAHAAGLLHDQAAAVRSEENTSALQSLMRISNAVFCLHNKHHHRS